MPLGAYWDEHGGVEGSGALVIHAPKPPEDRAIYETEVSQCVGLRDAEMFELTARFMSDKLAIKPRANRANVIWYESLDCSSGGQFGDYLEPQNATGWQTVSRKRIEPALGARAAKIAIVQQGRYSDDGHAYWDDVGFYASEVFEQSAPVVRLARPEFTRPLGSNYVSNGDFARDLSGWVLEWKVEWSGKGRTGTGSARVIASSAADSLGRHALRQCIDFGDVRRFALGASVKRGEPSNQHGGGRIRLTWYENEGCTGRARAGQKHADPKDVPGWQTLRVDGLVTVFGSRSAMIEIIQSVGGAGDFTLHWDDVFLERTE